MKIDKPQLVINCKKYIKETIHLMICFSIICLTGVLSSYLPHQICSLILSFESDKGYNSYNISTTGCFNLSRNPTFFDLNDTSVIDCQNWCYNATAFAVSVSIC